jgi:phospholipid/cholesterol/gamma-HCH transport system substrate-binding protein
VIQNKHHFVLGSFVLSGIALIGTSVTILGANALWEDYLIMETYIKESVSGLETGSPVKFRGITVGKVEEITTVSKVYDTMKSYAYVRVKVFTSALPIPPGAQPDHRIEDRVSQGLRVSLASSGITGGSYIEADYLDSSKTPNLAIDWTPTAIYVPSVPSTLLRFRVSLDALLDNLAKTDIQGVVAAARDTLRGFEKSMTDLDLAGLSKRTQTLLEEAATTVASAGQDFDKLTVEVNETLRGVRGTFGTTFKTADATLAAVNELLEKGKLEESLARLASLLEQADATVKEVRALAGRTDQTVAGIGQIVRGRSRDLTGAISNLRQILQNLNSLTGTLERYPSLLFVGNAPKGAPNTPANGTKENGK